MATSPAALFDAGAGRGKYVLPRVIIGAGIARNHGWVGDQVDWVGWLIGKAAFRVGDGEAVIRSAGEVIYHAPMMPHALRTTTEPLVIAYLWHGGDLREKPTFV